MKYICTVDEHGNREIIMFPKSIDHDCMAEGVEGLRDSTRDPWKRIHRMVDSAGFVTKSGVCFGRSETLGLSTKEGDTDLMIAQYGGY